MNYQIARIRLVSVGPEPARFDPLDLVLLGRDGVGPADTVLFLPNTGGKTVLLRLIFSVLHPPVVDTIGSEEASRRKSNLPGYVLERDTSHVIIEWRRAVEERFIDDEVLITGLVAEWRGGRPTNNPAGDLVKEWYSIRGPAEVVSADRLTVETERPGDDGAGRRRLPLRRYIEQIEEMGQSGPRAGVAVTIEKKQQRWLEHLDNLGLDRAIFRYQGEMNHNEAGASAIARFTTDLKFIEFFLNAVMDPDELAILDRQFDEVADKVQRYPEFERRVRFEEAALTELEPLAALVEEVATARHEAEVARSTTLLLLARFAAGATVARTRDQQERDRCKDRDIEARRLTMVSDRHRDEWRAYRQIGAKMWLAEAAKTHDTARNRTAHADLEVRAWAIAEDLVRLDEAEADLAALELAYTAELERIRPLREARDDAARSLSRRLAADLVIARAKEIAQKQRTAEAKTHAAAAREQERDALIEAAKLDAEREANERRIASVAARRARLVGEGLLGIDERADAAQQREVARAAASHSRIEAIDAELAVLEARRASLEEFDSAVKPRQSEIQERHGQLEMALRRALQERSRLAVEPLVHEMAEAQTFDLELVGPAVADRLLGRAAEADSARLNLELQGVDDRRALRGLDQVGLLPPPPDLETALARLTEAGISGALPGTRYLADAISAERRATVVGLRPELVGGIVMTNADDLTRAREVLELASVEPSMIIAVGAASDLVAAECADGESVAFVIPPAKAVWDRSAATSERARRQDRIAVLEEKRSELDARAKGARSLADALARHAAEYPPGWIGSQTAEREALGSELDRLERERLERHAERLEVARTLKELRAEAADHQRMAREAERRAGEIGRLADEEAETADLASLVERQRTDAASWRSVADVEARAAAIADREAEDALQVAIGQQQAADRIRREIGEVALAEAIAEPSISEAAEIVAGSASLPHLRALFEELERKLAGETSSSDVAARRAAAIKGRDKLRATIATHAEDVRARAAALTGLPEAGELAGRRAAAERADAEVTSARDAERDAYAVHDQAKKDLVAIDDEIRTSRRTTKIPDDRAPRDRHDAARLAAEARQVADTTQIQVAAAERERGAAGKAADEAKALVAELEGLATQLRMRLNLGTDGEVPASDPYEGEVDTARTAGIEASKRLTDAIGAADRAEKAWRTRDTAVRALLAREDFSDLAGSDRLYRRLVQSAPDLLARDAADLVAELRASIGILRADLETLSGDVKLATTSLARTVNKALSYLKLAETRSKMPSSLRDWAGTPFLIINFDKPPAEELETRLVTFVAAIMKPAPGQARPTGTRLLLEALTRAVVGDFKVQILKPNESFALIRVPISELSTQTFSNGQRSTVATALMLMLSELRRQSRSTQRRASVGALLLDNPFGNANAGFLIEVQRTVAAAAGIQLIYTTGIADLNALRRFPVVIALSNDSARRSMRRYVRANHTLLDVLVPPESGPGGRVSASRVVPSKS